MDSEDDILKAVERLMKDNKLSNLKALSMLHGKYQSERRLEEAVIVQRIIDKVKTENPEFKEGFYEDS
ncbi:MAG TPA: hypothetical protein VH500_01190 [Nitrososphaeraceae archaeon]|jgi:hypothetical protein